MNPRDDHVDPECTIVVADVCVQIQFILDLVAVLVAEVCLEDMVILKADVGRRLVEAHGVNLGKKNAK